MLVRDLFALGSLAVFFSSAGFWLELIARGS